MDETRGLTHLALGNSLMAAGFDSSAFDQYLGSPNAVAFNAGLGSSYPVEHLILLRRALRDHSTINTVIYGFFDLQLDFVPDETTPAIPAPPPGSPINGPSLLKALQQQLGLQLESTKGPVEVIVVDHAERPSAN